MSVNDPQSTQLDYHRVAGRPGMVGRRLVLLINNRPDRGYRTEHMMMVARGLEPEEIWLIGASQRAVRRTLRHILPDTPHFHISVYFNAAGLIFFVRISSFNSARKSSLETVVEFCSPCSL